MADKIDQGVDPTVAMKPVEPIVVQVNEAGDQVWRFRLLPRRLGLGHDLYQLFLLAPVFIFFFLLLTGLLPEPQVSYSNDDGTIPAAGPGALTYWGMFTSLSWIENGGLTLILTWWSLFALSISACCWGIVVSYAGRGAAIASQIEDGSLVYSIRIIGSVFGVVVVLLFLGGFLAGSLFPNFGDVGFRRIYSAFSSPVEWAKLIVWAFIAGFTERLIPNLIGTYAKRAERSAQGPG